jgi:excisionase family DNA binding protein
MPVSLVDLLALLHKGRNITAERSRPMKGPAMNNPLSVPVRHSNRRINPARIQPGFTGTNFTLRLAPSRGARPSQTMEPALVTIAQAAALLGIGRTSVYKRLLAPHGPIRLIKIGTASRILLADLRAWVAQQVEGGGA